MLRYDLHSLAYSSPPSQKHVDTVTFQSVLAHFPAIQNNVQDTSCKYWQTTDASYNLLLIFQPKKGSAPTWKTLHFNSENDLQYFCLLLGFDLLQSRFDSSRKIPAVFLLEVSYRITGLSFYIFYIYTEADAFNLKSTGVRKTICHL